MAGYCKECGKPFQWGFCDQRWVLLEPTETHADLEKSFVDEDGVPRADHRDRHTQLPSINVTRLSRRLPAEISTEPDLDEEDMSVGEVQDMLHNESPLGRFAASLRRH